MLKYIYGNIKYLRRERYLIMLICLLVVSTNLGLVNRFVSIQGAGGENLLGIRDMLVVLVIFYGLSTVRKPFALRSGMHLFLAAVLLMTPFAAIIGIMKGANSISVARDSVVMASWIIPFFASRYLQLNEKFILMGRVIICIGLLISIGVIIEGISGGRIALVTPAVHVLEMTNRSTPSGWPTMVMAANVLMALLLRDNAAPSRTNLWRFALFAVIVFASLLTQSRTLIVSIVGPMAIFIILSFFINPTRLRWGYLIGVIAIIPLVVFPFVLNFGTHWLRDDFSNYYRQRYSVLTTRDIATEKIESGDARIEELKVIFYDRLPESPLFGHGLSTIFRPGDSAILVHSIFGFFALRYGIPGLFLWIIFIFIVFRAMALSLRDNTLPGLWGQAFSAAVLSLIVGATFGNIFATTYGVNQSMIGVSCLMAYMGDVFVRLQQRRTAQPYRFSQINKRIHTERISHDGFKNQ